VPQLTVNGEWQGPHVFVVRLRDDSGGVWPGVRIADNGPKQGLLGVDNGQASGAGGLGAYGMLPARELRSVPMPQHSPRLLTQACVLRLVCSGFDSLPPFSPSCAVLAESRAGAP
jgi:hypothetical protein